MTQTSNRPVFPEYIQEFFLSDAVRCQDKGEVQLTVAVDSRQQLGTSFVTKIEYGATSRLQFGFELPYGTTEEERSDPSKRSRTASVGAMYQFIRSSFPFALSAGMALQIPTGSSGEMEYEPEILVAKSFHKLQIHANFVAAIEARERAAFAYNIASVYPVRRRWFPTFEFNARRLHDRNAFYMTPGIYRHFEHHLEFGAGTPLGIGGGSG